MSHSYHTLNGSGDGDRRRAQDRAALDVRYVLRAQVAGAVLGHLRAGGVPLLQAVGDAVEAADALLRRLRETEE